MKSCFRCGKAVEIGRTVARTDVCPHCDGDLRCCLNCKFYDRFAHQQCREPQAEFVSQKEKANFCDYIIFRDSTGGGKQKGSSSPSKEKLEQLFKKRK